MGIAETRANAVKIVVYYDPDADTSINDVKRALVERVGAKCQAYDILFLLEVFSYSDRLVDEKSLEFARVKPEKAKKITREFSQSRYGVDVLNETLHQGHNHSGISIVDEIRLKS